MSAIALSSVDTPRQTRDVPLWRLYLLRLGYLIIAVGLSVEIWPVILQHKPQWEIMHGVASCMLGAMAVMAVMAVIGLRYPLRMLPILLFEMAWKSIWLIAVALPLWQAGRVDAATAETIKACLMGVIFPFIIPWRYVWTHFVAKAGDRWW
jgi:hypothetical protein